MIAPIREVDPSSQGRSRTPRDVRRLVASLFLGEDRKAKPIPSVSRWKAWLLVVWAAVLTLVYCAAMLDLF